MTTPRQHPNAHILAQLAEIAKTDPEPWKRLEVQNDYYDKLRAPEWEVRSVPLAVARQLVVSYTKACGHDADRPITINGGENRDVTIHALKEGAASA